MYEFHDAIPYAGFLWCFGEGHLFIVKENFTRFLCDVVKFGFVELREMIVNALFEGLHNYKMVIDVFKFF